MPFVTSLLNLLVNFHKPFVLCSFATFWVAVISMKLLDNVYESSVPTFLLFYQHVCQEKIIFNKLSTMENNRQIIHPGFKFGFVFIQRQKPIFDKTNIRDNIRHKYNNRLHRVRFTKLYSNLIKKQTIYSRHSYRIEFLMSAKYLSIPDWWFNVTTGFVVYGQF